jgi:hypothetical protein
MEQVIGSFTPQWLFIGPKSTTRRPFLAINIKFALVIVASQVINPNFLQTQIPDDVFNAKIALFRSYLSHVFGMNFNYSLCVFSVLFPVHACVCQYLMSRGPLRNVNFFQMPTLRFKFHILVLVLRSFISKI